MAGLCVSQTVTALVDADGGHGAVFLLTSGGGVSTGRLLSSGGSQTTAVGWGWMLPWTNGTGRTGNRARRKGNNKQPKAALGQPFDLTAPVPVLSRAEEKAMIKRSRLLPHQSGHSAIVACGRLRNSPREATLRNQMQQFQKLFSGRCDVVRHGQLGTASTRGLRGRWGKKTSNRNR